MGEKMTLSSTGYEPSADKQARVRELIADGKRCDPSVWEVVPLEDEFFVQRHWARGVYTFPARFDGLGEAEVVAERLNAREAA